MVGGGGGNPECDTPSHDRCETTITRHRMVNRQA